MHRTGVKTPSFGKVESLIVQSHFHDVKFTLKTNLFEQELICIAWVIQQSIIILPLLIDR